jgi:hypothetical protein
MHPSNVLFSNEIWHLSLHEFMCFPTSVAQVSMSVFILDLTHAIPVSRAVFFSTLRPEVSNSYADPPMEHEAQ